jgi:AcrR family transcriptional regulator
MTDKKKISLDAVLEEAQRQFSTKRFNEVSMNDIAKRAKCSTATIYEAYESKEFLFLLTVSTFLADKAPTVPDTAQTPLFRVLHLAEAHSRAMASRARRISMRNLAIANLERDSSAHAGISERFQKFRARVTQAVKDAQADGALIAGDPEILSDQILAMTSWRSLLWGITMGADYPVGLTLREFLHRAFFSIVTPEGARAMEAYLAEITDFAALEEA